MNKFAKYTIRGVVIAIGLFFVAYGAFYLYLTLNKAEIVAEVKAQVADKLNGDVRLGDIDLSLLSTFPSLSVVIDDISIKDTLFNQHQHPFFTAEKVSVKLSLWGVLKKTNPLSGIKIENGQVYVYTDTSGYTNAYLFSPKKSADTTKKTEVKKLSIDDVKLLHVKLTLQDLKKKKLYSFDAEKFTCTVESRDSSYLLKTKADVLIHSLSMNTDNGSFVAESPFSGDFDVEFNPYKKQLSFTNIDIELKKHPFNLSGVFTFSEQPTFVLKVNTKNIVYNFARSLLTNKISEALSIVSVSGPVKSVHAAISGPLKGGDPLVIIAWKTSGNNVESPIANFTNCSFSGSFTNELIPGLPRKDPNSRLQLHNFAGDWGGLHLTSQHIYIDNLKTPMINCDISSEFDLTEFASLLESNAIEMKAGKGIAKLSYSGPILKNTSNNTRINGKVAFTTGQMVYTPRNVMINDVNGNIEFKNSDVFVTDFRGIVKESKIVMNGSGKNLLSLLSTAPGKISIDWNIYSPHLNLENFTTLLKKRSAAVKVKKSGGAKLSKLSDYIDDIVNQANFNVDVSADELVYQRFLATNVKASVTQANENWKLNNVRLQHGGGSMKLNAYLQEKNSNTYRADVDLDMQNVDVSKVMYAFKNFGQDAIEADNLRGKLSTTARVQLDLDREMASPSNLDGYIDFSLKKGALLNYEPLMKIQDVAFKNRNFKEITFAELKDRFELKNKEIKINKMEIASSVFTIFIEGIYSLRGNTDISIQLPLSNIEKPDENYKPKNKGKDSGGMSVYLRGRPGNDGNVQFKLDIFKKFRKDEYKLSSE